MKDNMDNNDLDLAETVAALKKLSIDELKKTRSNVRKIGHIFSCVGIIAILIMLAWPGVFSIILGVIVTWFMAQMAISSDLVEKKIDETLAKYEKL